MYCKKCGTQNSDNVMYCSSCGEQLQNNRSDAVEGIVIDSGGAQSSQRPLTFNIVYAIFALIGAATGVPNVITALTSATFVTLLSGLVLCAIAVYKLMMGIFLIQRKKAGKTMATIYSSISLVGNSLTTIGGLLLLGGGTSIINSTALGSILGVFGAAIGVVLIICGVGSLIFHICSLRYYSKNKDCFI